MDIKNFQKISTEMSNNGLFLTNPMQISSANTTEDKKSITNFEVKRENNPISNRDFVQQISTINTTENEKPITNFEVKSENNPISNEDFVHQHYNDEKKEIVQKNSNTKLENVQKNSNPKLENYQPVTLIAPWKTKEPFQNILVKTFDENGEITNVKSESIPIKPTINVINKIVNPSSEGEKNFQCLTCSVMFSRSTDLTRHHSIVHEGKKPFQCEICEYQTIRNYDLKRHVLKLHNRFPCEICSSIFYRDYELKAHLSNVHSISTFNSQSFLNILNTQDVSIFDGKAFYEGKKNILCTICNSQFSSHSNLRSHITQVHERKRPHKCGTCDYQFSRRFDMKRHIERVHHGKKKVDNPYSQGYV